MGEITDKINAYRAGELSWLDLRDYLAGRRYPTPQRYLNRPNYGDDPAAWWNDVEATTLDCDEGTWDEVQRAFNRGWLSGEQELELGRMMEARRG